VQGRADDDNLPLRVNVVARRDLPVDWLAAAREVTALMQPLPGTAQGMA
jgi:hypothetical protein